MNSTIFVLFSLCFLNTANWKAYTYAKSNQRQKYAEFYTEYACFVLHAHWYYTVRKYRKANHGALQRHQRKKKMHRFVSFINMLELYFLSFCCRFSSRVHSYTSTRARVNVWWRHACQSLCTMHIAHFHMHNVHTRHAYGLLCERHQLHVFNSNALRPFCHAHRCKSPGNFWIAADSQNQHNSGWLNSENVFEGRKRTYLPEHFRMEWKIPGSKLRCAIVIVYAFMLIAHAFYRPKGLHLVNAYFCYCCWPRILVQRSTARIAYR